MNSFYEKIYSKLRQVPKGKVTTYKALANSINSKAYRAVGTAMNKNPYGYATFIRGKGKSCHSVIRGDSKRTSGCFLVPCHRVINSDGRIGGFASGTANKIKMLKAEGIIIVNGKIDTKKFSYKFK